MAEERKKKNPVKKTVNQEVVFSAKEVFSMVEDTSQIIAQENTTRLSAMGPAASESGTLTDSVEFWSWMNRNYEKSGHFASSESMRSYMTGTPGQQNWAKKSGSRAEKDGDVIAASIMIFANGHLNFHLSGSLEEYNALAPNNLIVYNAAIWGHENGYKSFHLGGGVGSKDDTLLRYKKTFYKGERNHFFIRKKIISPEKYNYLVNLRGIDNSQYFPQYRV